MVCSVPERCQHLIKEIGILEVTEQSQIDTKAAADDQLALPGGFRPVHPTGQQKIGHRNDAQQEKIEPAALIIEIIGKQRNEQQPGRRFTLQKQVNQAESEEQPKKSPLLKIIGC